MVQTVRSVAFNEFMSEMKDERLDYSYIRINQNESSSDIKLLFNELLNPANRPTAVGITSCFMSQFMDVVKGYGIRIPEDLSVMILEYYKNSNVDDEYQDFTCVESKAEKVTRIAMRKLVKLIDSGKPFESELVGLKVCVKNSTSKPKNKEAGSYEEKIYKNSTSCTWISSIHGYGMFCEIIRKCGYNSSAHHC